MLGTNNSVTLGGVPVNDRNDSQSPGTGVGTTDAGVTHTISMVFNP